MKRIKSLDEIKRIGLQGLQTFDRFCRENDLKYSLAAGTMLGAVRHKGFIPWDDDVDIYMDRVEYDKFICLIKQGKKLDNMNFEVCLPEKKNYPYPFVKIINNKTVVYEKNIKKEYSLGVWLDIFPLDYCGETKKEAEKIYSYMGKNSRKLMQLIMHYEEKNIIAYLKNCYIWVFRNIIKGNYLIYKKQKLSYQFPCKTKYKGLLIWPYLQAGKLCDVYLDEWFQEYEEIEFEGDMYMVFSCYKEILQKRYGDYMQLPPKEAQVSHAFEAYYLE